VQELLRRDVGLLFYQSSGSIGSAGVSARPLDRQDAGPTMRSSGSLENGTCRDETSKDAAPGGHLILQAFIVGPPSLAAVSQRPARRPAPLESVGEIMISPKDTSD